MRFCKNKNRKLRGRDKRAAAEELLLLKYFCMKSSRRDFLQISGLAFGALGLCTAGPEVGNKIVSIIADPDDPVASSPHCRWARREILRALERHAIKVGEFASLQQAPRNSLCIVASAPDRGLAASTLKQAGLTLSNDPESLALLPFSDANKRGILACGDARGLMYVLLELADPCGQKTRTA